jgi:hypothetical protein
MKPAITLPAADGSNNTFVESSGHNLVIIGANGAGKSRMGFWLESNQPENVFVHRISAQRALGIPDAAEFKTVELAEKGLFFGHASSESDKGYKPGHRYGGKGVIHQISDFEHLLATLFAKTNLRNEEHTKATQAAGNFVPVPDSVIDTIIKIWPDIMSQNTINFTDGKVMSTKAGIPQYHGKEMSDGERVSLYLIGQCLSTPDDSIIVIDEPEIHLHKSLMSRLWNKIEELCPNKLIVFITHDLDFAASRKDSKKFWVKTFNGTNGWTWEEVPELQELPENLVIEIIGNRKNILFCEGDKSSYDYLLYQEAYPAYHVIPRGGCAKVIESTKAINDNPAINHINATGIIDRDYRTAGEIEALNAQRIFTIEVAEVENLLCIEQILRIVAQHLHLNPNTIVTNVTNFIITELQNELETQVTNHAQREIQFLLNRYTKQSNSLQGLEDGMTNLLATVNVANLYGNSKTLFETAITENNLQKALLIYNRKKLPERISSTFGLVNKGYVDMIFRLLKSDQKAGIVAALQGFLPAI